MKPLIFNITPDIGKVVPEYRAIILGVQFKDLKESAHTLGQTAWSEAVSQARRKYTTAADCDTVKQWRGILKKFVKNRHRSGLEGVMRFALSDSAPDSFSHPIVDLYNAASVLFELPLGGEDLAHTLPPLTLCIASGGEVFDDSAKMLDDPEVISGEPVWMDDGGVTCRFWNSRQCRRTRIVATTRSLYFLIDVLGDEQEIQAKSCLAWLREKMTEAAIDPEFHEQIIAPS